MKRKYTILVLALIFCACKKESSISIEAQSSTEPVYYAIGTILKNDTSSLNLRDRTSWTYIPPLSALFKTAAKFKYGPGDEVAKSINDQYTLLFQLDGNLVLRKGTLVMWESNQYSSGVGTYIEFQGDGNIVCHRPDDSIYWASNAVGGPKPIWVLQDDGNFVGYKNYTTSGSDIIITDAPFASTNSYQSTPSTYFGTVRHL